MPQTVQPNSLVTLHYRIALNDETEIISTFGASPATLQLGSGELVPTLERCLTEAPLGERCVFLLEPEQAFGAHNLQLMQRMPRKNLPNGEELKELALIEFKAPNGAAYTGFVRELDEETALVDFNHPLAGKAIRFEVEVIGIL